MLFSFAHRVARFFKFSSKKNEALKVGVIQKQPRGIGAEGDGKNSRYFEIPGMREGIAEMKRSSLERLQQFFDLVQHFR